MSESDKWIEKEFENIKKTIEINKYDILHKLKSYSEDLRRSEEAIKMNDDITKSIKHSVDALITDLNAQDKSRRALIGRFFAIGTAVLTAVLTAAVLAWMGYK